MTRHISVTFDYRCPFARNANEAVVAALRSDALADVEWRFVPFSLDQSHLEEGEVPSLGAGAGRVGDRRLGVVVRDRGSRRVP